MNRFQVIVAPESRQDLVEIYRYVAMSDGQERADRLLDQLEEACFKLDTLPTRGHAPPELERLGLGGFREVHVGPYRIFYKIAGNEVRVGAVLDGRRDITTILQKRLLR